MMRQKVKRRWFACLWTLFFVFIMWTLISYYRSKSGASSPQSQYKRPEDVKVKLIIVEEHHEVLQAWTEAYLNGYLPPNSTLVHIDAHSDDGLPQWTPSYPNFRPPRNEIEVDQMMQANDRFIVGAKIANLIDRNVWIYPFWNEDVVYKTVRQSFGTTVFRGSRAFCQCDTKDKSLECQVLYEESTGPEPLAIIPERLCRVRRVTQMEMIRDLYARTRLPVDKGWLGRDSLLLDIDEDFFGVQLVGSTLIAAGVEWKDAEALSAAVSRIMCPLIPVHENIADQWFYSLVETIRNNCVGDHKGGHSAQLWCTDSRSAVKSLFRPFRANKTYSKLFCQWEKSADVDFDAKRAFVGIWNTLRAMNPTQLLAVRRAGVCLQASMRTFGQDPKLHLCVGSNTPNNSQVVEHVASPAELSQQYERFRLIIQHLPSRPRIITLCRSSRDGYVPRSQQAEIEHQIVSIVRDVFKLSENDVVYDNLLLNGKAGDWHNRVYNK